MEYWIKKSLKDNLAYLDSAEKIILECQRDESNIKDIISDIRVYQELDYNKGKISNDLIKKIEENPRQEVELWINKYKRCKNQLDLQHRQVCKEIEEFSRVVRGKIQDEILKNRILASLEEVKADSYRNNLVSFNSMRNHFKRK